MAQARERSEARDSIVGLTMLAASPVIWSLHFLLSYITAAIWCAKYVGPDSSLWPVRVTIAVYTLLALVGIAIFGWIGYRRHSRRDTDRPHDRDTAEDRYQFLGYATLLLSALSAVATIYVALTAIFVETCH